MENYIVKKKRFASLNGDKTKYKCSLTTQSTSIHILAALYHINPCLDWIDKTTHDWGDYLQPLWLKPRGS